MSRMTKFLKQTCRVEIYKVTEDGNVEQNRFGEIMYEAPIEVKCRHEHSTKTFQVANGSLVRSISRYFLDEKLEIKPNYRIDGHVVISVEEYVNERGNCEGFEVYV